MVITLSDDEVFDHESGSDEDGNFITFTAIAIVDKSVVVDEKPFDSIIFFQNTHHLIYQRPL